MEFLRDLKKMKNRLLVSIAALAVVLSPQNLISADAAKDKDEAPEEGSAAGEKGIKTAVGGINAGTVAAIIAIAAAAAALSDSGSGGGMITPTPTPTPTPLHLHLHLHLHRKLKNTLQKL